MKVPLYRFHKLLNTKWLKESTASIIFRGGTRNFLMEGADSSYEGAKIWHSRYYKCQKSPKIAFHLMMGS